MIIENGTGLPNADSYAALAPTTTFHADRGNDAWVTTTAKQTSGLIRATDFMEQTYRANGEPLSLTQALQWPRLGDYGLDPRVVRATMLLALEALSGPLTGRVDRGVKSQTKELDGVGSTSTTYDDVAPADPFPHITALLADIATLRASTPTMVSGTVTR